MALAQRGLAVTVVAFDRDAEGSLLSVCRSVEDGLPHVRIATPAPWHRLLGFYAPAVLARRLRDIIHMEAPDVVHAHAVRPAAVVTHIAAASADIRWCVTEHSGPLGAFWWTAHGKRQIDRAYIAADRLFGVSNSMLGEMKRHFPGSTANAELLHNGINTDIFRPRAIRENRQRIRLLFVGGLVPEKGVSNLLRAVAALPSDVDWTLSLVGAGSLGPVLRDEAEALGISSKLDWLGAVPHARMPEIYAANDVLVVSSLVETFSLVAAEALACGVPVVSTRCGGPEEVIGPLGLPLVPPGDAQALSRAILDMRDRLPAFDRNAAIESVHRRFSMSALAAKLEMIYAEMIEEPK